MIELFHTVFINPILNLLVGFYQLFLYIKLPGAFGFSLIALTSIIRLLLHPFFDKQMHTTRKMAELKPHLDVLTQKHKKDPKKLQQEQMRLYKEAGINPATGCLFVIIQLPIFIALYNTLSLVLKTGSTGKVIADINKALYFPFMKITAIDPHFFGVNLALSPSHGVQAGFWGYLLIPVITGVTQYFQVLTTSPPPVKKEVKKDEKKTDDFQSAMQTQMKYIFPFMIGYFSYTLPIGLSLYWNIFSLFSIIHYRLAHSKEKMSTLDVLTH